MPTKKTGSFTPLFLGMLCLAASPYAGAQQPASSMNDNPLSTESTLPFHYPRFDALKNEHFAPAFEQGMAEHEKEVEAIAKNAEKPSFDNTIVALEKSGQLLSRTSRVFFSLTSCNTNPDLQ